MKPELLDEFGADIVFVRYESGEVIFREGEPGDCLYLVCEGSILISKEGRGGKQETLGLIEAGNFFGEMALIDGQPRSAQASAAESVLLGKVGHDAFESIMERTPRIVHRNFLRTVVERLRGVNAHYISELMRNERMALVGSMANSIIHDLKNPIHCIRSCLEILQKKAPDPALDEIYQVLTQATDRMNGMTQELLDFARGQSSIQLQESTVSVVIGELLGQMRALIPDNIRFVCDGSDCPARFMADVGRFARMLLNLVKNSIEAMPDGGMLWIKARARDGHVLFRICDTGCGIDPALQPRIFEPFVTFGKAKGTGLGMSIVKGVVDAHGGTIQLESEPGVGTTVEVRLPALADLPQNRFDLKDEQEPVCAAAI